MEGAKPKLGAPGPDFRTWEGAEASGTTNYTYDNMDRLTAKATPEGTLSYTYDAAGHVASISSSNTNGASMSYTYDTLDRLSTVTDNRLMSGSNVTTYTYDTANNVAMVLYPNGVQSTFAYDKLNRISGLSSQPASYTYQRDFAGNLTSVVESSGRNVNWTYDGIYRLTNETISLAPSGKDGGVGYGLDPVGNRTSATSTIPGFAPVSGGFNQDDELASENYDLDGNAISSGVKTFNYNSQDQLVSMNGGAVQIVYDGDGNRVAKTVVANGVPTTTYYLVDDLNPTGYPQVVEELQGGAVTRQYTYGLQRIDENQFISNAWTPSFYGYDGGGNVRQLTNALGTVTDTYDYDAFGNKINSTGSTPNNYLYRGEQFDSDLGLYYLRARYYNPITGRFVSMDPENGIITDPMTLHKYIYANGDPVNAFDPTGREGQTTTWGRPGIEYVGLVAAISLGVAKSAPLVAQAASCVFDTAASLLKGVTTNLGRPIVGISFDAGTCSAKVRKCKPCSPVPAGELGYRLDDNQLEPHHDKQGNRDILGDHWHLFFCNQRPPEAGCTCNWEPVRWVGKQQAVAAGALVFGVNVETTACSGGGIETE
ncbi:MAG TPA: RHS repeat-associated core domain-containing protein [Terracidiphilus sp.]|jgi:RHS repeat-associated protein